MLIEITIDRIDFISGIKRETIYLESDGTYFFMIGNTLAVSSIRVFDDLA